VSSFPQEPVDRRPGPAPGKTPPPPPGGLPPAPPLGDALAGPAPPPLPQSQSPLAEREGDTSAPSDPGLAQGADPGGKRSVGEPGWSAWQGLLGFVAAFVATAVLGALVVGLVAVASGASLTTETPVLNVIGVVIQHAVFIVTALAFAAITVRPRAWHFGLRRTRLWPTIGWAALGLFLYYVFNRLYEALVNLRAEQGIADALGFNKSVTLLLIGAFLTIVMAPIAEELFFRGFFYRSLRNSFARRLGVPAGAVLGALATGLLFGVIHIEPNRVAETVPLVPLLAALGVMFCLVYERTRSLFSVIALHVAINMSAFILITKNVPVGLAFGGTMIALCVLVPRRLSSSPAPQPA
jgi:membrane protease YdiL (CAAX protease family)